MGWLGARGWGGGGDKGVRGVGYRVNNIQLHFPFSFLSFLSFSFSFFLFLFCSFFGGEEEGAGGRKDIKQKETKTIRAGWERRNWFQNFRKLRSSKLEQNATGV